jgi:probable rRNA maturation factor
VEIFLFKDSETEFAQHCYQTLLTNIKEIKHVFPQFVEKAFGEVNIIIASSPKIHELNKEFRDVDDTTDVLAFPLEDRSLRGEVWIDPEVIEQNAEKFDDDFERELVRIIIHGLLHIFGFDHKGKFHSNRDTTEEMFKLQEEILQKMELEI